MTTGSDLTPGYKYNKTAGRYIGPDGRFVAGADVRRALDATIDTARGTIEQLGQGLIDGRLSLANWQLRMMAEVKTIHLASAAAAAGGWAQMTPKDWGRVGAQLRSQYAYLQRFAIQIETGRQRLDGSLVMRARMYANAGRGTYEDQRRIMATIAEMTQERRILGAADHCVDCVTYAGRGWRPIGTLPRIGASRCMTNCRCSFEYRQMLDPIALGGFGL